MSNKLRGDPVVDRIMQKVLTEVTHWVRENSDMHITVARNEQSNAVRFSIKRRVTLNENEKKSKSLNENQKQKVQNFLRTLLSLLGLIETPVGERCANTKPKGKTPELQIDFLLPSNLQPLQ